MLFSFKYLKLRGQFAAVRNCAGFLCLLHSTHKNSPQTWTDNMGKAGEMKLKHFDGEDYTCVTFQPDLSKFKMTTLDKDIVALMSRRAYDIAGSTKDVKVFLNGKRLPVSEHLNSTEHLCFSWHLTSEILLKPFMPLHRIK